MPELATKQVQSLHEEFFAREAMLDSRIAELDRQLRNHRPDMLLEYILGRFGHRIVWLDEPDGFASAMAKQIAASQLTDVRSEQIERCVVLARNVSSDEGRLLVHGALRALVAIQNLDPQAAGVAEALGLEITSAIWSATEEILRAVASLEFVTAKLVEAMQTYLKISEEFSRSAV